MNINDLPYLLIEEAETLAGVSMTDESQAMKFGAALAYVVDKRNGEFTLSKNETAGAGFKRFKEETSLGLLAEKIKEFAPQDDEAGK